jgi:poly(A) polymerase
MEAGNSGNSIPRLLKALVSKGYGVRLCSFSALDRYLGVPPLPFVLVETEADIVSLAGAADELDFPGAVMADAAADSDAGRVFFRCLDIDEPAPGPTFQLLSLTCDVETGHFIDREGIYPLLRSLKKAESTKDSNGAPIDLWWKDLNLNAGRLRALFDAALILAHYRLALYPPDAFIDELGSSAEAPSGAEIQRALLTGLMVSSAPERGLRLLNAAGFLKKFWPEIARLDTVDHSKEFHPEGNAWQHTLETFCHRKPNAAGEYDLRLSLALLLHDIGKPLAEGSGRRRFDGHAELGANAASRFLERLGFDAALYGDIFYLVKNHMLPAALARLSLAKTEDVMNSPLFPSLMELYRCDESSSFKGLDRYYENSAAYQAYLRNTKNPYRAANGKILGHGRTRRR